jgi:hypothetical protein
LIKLIQKDSWFSRIPLIFLVRTPRPRKYAPRTNKVRIVILLSRMIYRVYIQVVIKTVNLKKT